MKFTVVYTDSYESLGPFSNVAVVTTRAHVIQIEAASKAQILDVLQPHLDKMKQRNVDIVKIIHGHHEMEDWP